MSEYQYYEFQAIDRALTPGEMQALRACSTRARITPTSFVNDYAYGSFKGNEDAWMAKYFDAYLYLANWGTHALKLRLPSRLLDARTARRYCAADDFAACEEDGHVILSWHSEDEEGDGWVEGEGRLAALVAVRAELARGDLRALYLGWLLCVQGGELEESLVEPPVPPGLDQLGGALEGFADFLRIDPDLLAVAAEASASLEKATPRPEAIRAWVADLPSRQKDDVLAELIAGKGSTAVAELRKQFLAAQKVGRTDDPEGRRTVVGLLAAAERHRAARVEAEARAEAEAKARQDRKAARARGKQLDALAGQEPSLWLEVDRLIGTKQPKSYDQAISLLGDLRDLASRNGGAGFDFGLRMTALRAEHVRKPSLVERLQKAGL